MDLKIKDKWFLVGGASSGLGKAVTERLISEGANILAIARNEDKLRDLDRHYPGKIKYISADLSHPDTLIRIDDFNKIHGISGVLVNAGGPPAMSFMETTIEDWDSAYHLLLRWKIQIVKLFLPEFIKKGYGRFVFIESVSVKQPVENLVLSNSLRMSVAGMMKTVSGEVAGHGVTLNLIGPGYHDTAALQRLIKKKSELTGMSYHETREKFVNEIPVGILGNPEDFATLAAWLLSPLSKYVTGQTFYLDGGIIRSSV